MAVEAISPSARAILTKRMRDIESLPDLHAHATQLNWRRRRYPFHRGLTEYLSKMPNLAEALPVSDRILDIGCGAGIAAQQIRQIHAAAEVVTTGIAPTDGADPQILTTAHQLPFDNCSFDLVMAVQSISWEPDQIGAIREASRVLRTGGQAHLFLTPFSYGIEHRWGNAIWNELGEGRAEIARREFRADHPDLPEKVTIYPTRLPNPFGKHDTAFYLTLTK